MLSRLEAHVFLYDLTHCALSCTVIEAAALSELRGVSGQYFTAFLLDVFGNRLEKLLLAVSTKLELTIHHCHYHDSTKVIND